jgi:drug/metabolite transporter (DMT)-like permease
MKLYKGVILIILSAVCAATGQYLWKLSQLPGGQLYVALIGFIFYALGAALMILAFRYGELSVLHPMLSVSYVLAIVVGYFTLQEPVTVTKVGGVAVIFLGMVFLGLSSRREKHE